MKEEIKECILKLYPTGKFEEKNTDVLFGEDYLKKLNGLLEKLAEKGKVNYAPRAWSPSDSSFDYIVTLKEDLNFKEWDSLSDEEKAEWLKETNRKYTAVWLVFSRIYPLYELYFDSWIISQNTGKLFIEEEYWTSDERWEPFLESIGEILKEHSIQKLSDEELLEEVTFVTEKYFEEDDPAPRYRETNLYQCLFQ